jgi:hypothetical protein
MHPAPASTVPACNTHKRAKRFGRVTVNAITSRTHVVFAPVTAAAKRATIAKETSMRLWRFGWLVLPALLAGCGGGDKPATTLSVTCGGSVALAGATSIDVLGDPVNGRPTISFPDPANRGKTGSMAIPPATRCTITPTAPPST